MRTRDAMLRLRQWFVLKIAGAGAFERCSGISILRNEQRTTGLAVAAWLGVAERRRAEKLLDVVHLCRCWFLFWSAKGSGSGL